MDNRTKEMNDFLKDLAKIYSQNPNFQITSDAIYHTLMTYGINDEIQAFNLRENFSSWLNRFERNRNLDVFYTNKQGRFLQFQGKNHNYGNVERHVKLYLSFPKDKMYDAVNRIFDFISQNKMPSGSKVADTVRTDSIILRLDNEIDARKVMNYVNSQPDLVNSAYKTNPFLIRNGIFGMAHDELLSYNKTLSYVLENYFKYAKHTKVLDKVSVDNLRWYSDLFYKHVIVNKNYSEITKELKMGTSQSEINNLEKVLSIINISLDSKANVDTYFDYYNKINQNSINVQKQSQNSVPNRHEKASSLLEEYIKYAFIKYKDQTLVIKYLNSYMSGNVSAITRDNNFRERFYKELSPKKLKSISKDIEAYVNAVVSKNKKSNIQDEYALFEEICLKTCQKYGSAQLEHALKEAKRGNYTYFTDGNRGYRSQMASLNMKDKIELYCTYVPAEEIDESINEPSLKQVFINYIEKKALGKNEEFNNKLR